MSSDQSDAGRSTSVLGGWYDWPSQIAKSDEVALAKALLRVMALRMCHQFSEEVFDIWYGSEDIQTTLESTYSTHKQINGQNGAIINHEQYRELIVVFENLLEWGFVDGFGPSGYGILRISADDISNHIGPLVSRGLYARTIDAFFDLHKHRDLGFSIFDRTVCFPANLPALFQNAGWTEFMGGTLIWSDAFVEFQGSILPKGAVGRDGNRGVTHLEAADFFDHILSQKGRR